MRTILFKRWDAGKAIRKVFREMNITVAYTSDYERNPSNTYIVNTLKKVKEEARSKCFTRPSYTLKKCFSHRMWKHA